jgi:site-specific recombinase XerD
MGKTSKILRDAQNFGQGRSLLSDETCEKIATIVATANGRGTATIDKIVAALHNFREYLSEQGIKTLEKVEQETFDAYARTLSTQLTANEISPSTAAGRITALNTVFAMDPANRGIHISARDFQISRGDRISRWDKSLDATTAGQIRAALTEKFEATRDIRFLSLAAAISLQRAGGLRFRESCRIHLAAKDFSSGVVHMAKAESDGAKNSQDRSFVPINDGIKAFQDAQDFQKSAEKQLYRGSLIPGDMTYKNFRNFAYNTLKSINEKIGNETPGFHCNRHHYAHQSYSAKWEQRTGHAVKAPLAAGCLERGEWKSYASKITGLSKAECFRIDREIRRELTEELGHHQIAPTNSYLGSSV